MTGPLPDILQSFELTLETLARLTTVTERLIEIQRVGGSIALPELGDYAAQLRKVTADRKQLQALIATWWLAIGGDAAH